MMKSIYSILAVLALTGFLTQLRAQEVVIPDPNLNTAIHEALGKPAGPLTQLDMLGLTNLSAIFRNISSVQGLETARNLISLDLQDNRITNVNVLTNLTKLTVLDLSENRFAQLTIPGLTNLTTLRLENGGLTNLIFPAGLTKLISLRAGFNQLSNLVLPADMTNLSLLSLFQNQLANLIVPPTLTNLNWLDLDGNQLRSLTLPAGLTKLNFIALGGNQLTSFTVPADMTNLMALRINDNQLTNLTLPAGLNQLSLLVASRNQLGSLTFPPGLTSLAFLELVSNQLTNITFPPDLQQLSGLFLADNPLMTFVLSEPLAAAGLASIVDSFRRTQDVSVFTYPLTVNLVGPRRTADGAFQFALTAPPGTYLLIASTNLTTWSGLGVVTNPFGSVRFADVEANLSPQKFYRALLQVPPANMAFIPPNTFTLGTPGNEANRQADEGPQTTVTLSHGFWIGKYEVTQREYLAVTGSNPSQFPGDLNRPVETVSWLDATNYCALLTQQDLAAGRIPPGSHYRLPTEAEWECAARAGTATRFSYGDDPNFTGLTSHAWYSGNSGFGTHPVGQKTPNPWGLFDMEGNVLEWTLDWYGPYPGGSVTDPQGPATNAQGTKVIRGGAWDSFQSDCRSGRRMTEGVSPFIHDFILGFRVVLETGV